MQAREQTNEQALRIIRFLFTGVGLRIPSTAPFHVQERLMNILRKLFKKNRCQAGWNKNVLFGFS